MTASTASRLGVRRRRCAPASSKYLVIKRTAWEPSSCAPSASSGNDEIVEHGGAATQQLPVIGRSPGQLVDRRLHRVQNLVDGVDPHADHSAQALDDIKDEPVHRLLGGGEVATLAAMPAPMATSAK